MENERVRSVCDRSRQEAREMSKANPIRCTMALLAALLFAACAPAPAPSSPGARVRAPIGAGCASDADCEVGATCDKDDPGGQCTKKCSASSDCGAGNVCRPDEKECFQACHTQADCKRAGYVCMGKAPETFCDVPEEAEKH